MSDIQETGLVAREIFEIAAPGIPEGMTVVVLVVSQVKAPLGLAMNCSLERAGKVARSALGLINQELEAAIKAMS